MNPEFIKTLNRDIEISQRFKEARGDVTLQELSQLTGFSASSCLRIEQGNASPKVTYLTRFCKALNVNPLWIMFGDGEPSDRFVNDINHEQLYGELLEEFFREVENEELDQNLLEKMIKTFSEYIRIVSLFTNKNEFDLLVRHFIEQEKHKKEARNKVL